jgi:CRP-like cAMP-binding protein
MNDKTVDASMLLPVLRQIPLFSKLDENLHHEIIQHIVLMYYPENYVIFKENDQPDALYIIKKGKIKIYHEPKEQGDLPKEIAEIDEHGFFGEMALISDVARNASAKTVTESEVFILSKDDFKKLLNNNPALAEQISATMVDRLNKNDKQNL